MSTAAAILSAPSTLFCGLLCCLVVTFFWIRWWFSSSSVVEEKKRVGWFTLWPFFLCVLWSFFSSFFPPYE